jgi:hypothetical protein
VVPFFPPTLLISNEKVNLLYSIIEVHCWEHQLVEFPQLENMIVLVTKPLHQ